MKTKLKPSSKFAIHWVVCLVIGIGFAISPLRAALAEDPKSTTDQVSKDLLIVCEMSKLSINLAKTAPFKDDPADLAYRVAEMMSGAFKTSEVKDAYKAIVEAPPESRVELWHKTAKDLGVKNFKCKTIGFK